MFGIRLIIILLIVSGGIAFIGDWVGRAIGRRRLTLFRLRPRYTAIAITTATGILIAVITLVTLIVVSQDVRTALFGLEELRGTIAQKSREVKQIKREYLVLEEELKEKTSQRESLEKELAWLKERLSASKQEIAGLEQVKKKLLSEVKTARKGAVIYKVGEPIITTVMEGGGRREDIENKLKDTLSLADGTIRRLGVISEERLIFVPTPELYQAASYIERRRGPIIVRVTAARNIVFGETAPVHFELFENILVFAAKEEITTGIIDGRKSIPEIEHSIKDVLAHVNYVAREKGIIPDPETGTIGNIPYGRIFEIAKKIKNWDRIVDIKVMAAKDTYTIGPLEVDLQIEE